MLAPHRLTRARAALAAMAAITPLLVATPASADGQGMCNADASRGTAPGSFPLDTCIDSTGIWVRNGLQVPVRLSTSGDTGQPTLVRTDLGAAASMVHSGHPDPLVLTPGDRVRIPIGDGSAHVTIADTLDGKKFALATAFFTYAGDGVLATEVYKNVTSLISEVAAALDQFEDCVKGANFITQAGCQLTYDGDMTFAFGRFGLSTIAKGVLALFLDTRELLKFVNAQVPDVSRILHGARTVDIAARSTGDTPQVAPPSGNDRPAVSHNDPPTTGPAPDPNTGSNGGGTTGGGQLSVSFSESPYVCDGGLRYFATVSGAQPSEAITFSSPTVGGMRPGTADGNGQLNIKWQCNPDEAGQHWSVTASGSSSGRSVTFDVAGAAPPSSGGGTGTGGGAQLTVTFSEKPFRCDGTSHHLGTLSGALAGETVSFTSATVSGMLDGHADGAGNVNLIWQCQPNEVGQSWTVTATGQSSGRTGDFTVTGG